MSAYDGGPAFPFTPTDKSGQIGPAYEGMSLRDWFAGMAMSGFAGRMAMTADDTNSVATKGKFYEIADAMLAARGKEDT